MWWNRSALSLAVLMDFSLYSTTLILLGVHPIRQRLQVPVGGAKVL